MRPDRLPSTDPAVEHFRLATGRIATAVSVGGAATHLSSAIDTTGTYWIWDRRTETYKRG